MRMLRKDGRNDVFVVHLNSHESRLFKEACVALGYQNKSEMVRSLVRLALDRHNDPRGDWLRRGKKGK